MPRLARKYLESSFIHIIVQGINKEYIFQKNSLKEAYLNILKKNISETDIKIVAYCVMDNHIHILIYSENIDNVSKMMQRTNGAYAKLYNKNKNRVGYVFRNRFYTQMILTEQQLCNCIVYIHRNPLKANIVDSFQGYKYSSYREYLGKRSIISDDSIKLVFGNAKDFLDTFKAIHKTGEIEDIKDIVEDFTDEKIIIDEYLKEKEKTIFEIKENKELLAGLIFRLRYQGGLSLRAMEKTLGISKSLLAIIINKNLK